MRPLSFKILFALVFMTIQSFSQTKEVILKKSFKVNENTILDLDLDNVAILFKESFDGKIHFDYSMTFGRYSKRKREMIVEQAKVNVTKNKDLINLDVKNSALLGINHVTYLSIDSLTSFLKGYARTGINKEIQYKTKDSLIDEIRFSEGNNLEDFLKKKKMRNRDVSSFKNKKVIKKVFIIKVPKNVSIRLKALNSNITFDYNIDKPIVANTFKGFLKFKKITSQENKFFMTLGVFETEEIVGGDYTLKDVSKALIGSVSNAKIDTETSKIQLGEIGEKVTIKDFNSNLFLYNFSSDFKSFKLTGEYSKIHFYEPTEDYSLTALGNDTTFHHDGNTIVSQPSKENKSFKMMVRKPKKDKPFSGKIKLDITHSIFYYLTSANK